MITPKHRVLRGAIARLESMNHVTEALHDLCRGANRLDVHADGFSQLLLMINNSYCEVHEQLQKLDAVESVVARIEQLRKEIVAKRGLEEIYATLKPSETKRAFKASLEDLKTSKSELAMLESKVASFTA